MIIMNKFFKIGDRVKKIAGDFDVGKTGEVITILYNAKGEIILSVQTAAVEWARTLRDESASWAAVDCEMTERS